MNSIISTLQYFNFFDHPASLEEIYIFYPEQIELNDLRKQLDDCIDKGIIEEREGRYVLQGHRKIFDEFRLGVLVAERKIKRLKIFLKLLSFFSHIFFLGLSGSLAMGSVHENEDIDLFLITKQGRVWTARFIVLFFAQVLGLRGSKNRDRICLNLIFDEAHVYIPSLKQNEYVAHEVLQLQPLLDKQSMYERFLAANTWVYQLFPNAYKEASNSVKNPNNNRRSAGLNKVGDWIEEGMKRLQLVLLRKQLSSASFSSSQLWLIQDDFQKKLPFVLRSL